jgi:uncharacterized protein
MSWTYLLFLCVEQDLTKANNLFALAEEHISYLKAQKQETQNLFDQSQQVWTYEMFYQDGLQCEARQDYKNAADRFIKSADGGNPYAQHKLALLYANGNEQMGIEKSAKQAIHYCKLSADQGYSDAQFELGEMYWNDSNAPPDDAIKYFAQSAMQGNTDAQWRLAEWYLLQKDYNLAIRYFTLLDQGGNKTAQLRLVHISFVCMGYTTDTERGSNSAFNYLKQYLNLAGTAKDTQVFKCLKDSASQGAPEDRTTKQLVLGMLYMMGYGTARDLKKAQKYFEKYPEDADALGCLGFLFYVQEDTPKAILYLKMSEQISGNPHRQCLLGNAYKECGKTLDALRCYQKSMEQKVPRAKQGYLSIDEPMREAEGRYLDAMSKLAAGPLGNVREAHALLIQSAEAGHYDANVQLGKWHQFGCPGAGIQSNIGAAVSYYDQAIKGGSEEAQKLRGLVGFDHSPENNRPRPSPEHSEKKKRNSLFQGFRKKDS